MVSRVASSAGLGTSVDVMARTMKLTPNAGPMPAPFPIVSQTDQVQRHATKTAFSEYKCHRIPFALSSKRSGSSSRGIYLWLPSPISLGSKNANHEGAVRVRPITRFARDLETEWVAEAGSPPRWVLNVSVESLTLRRWCVTSCVACTKLEVSRTSRGRPQDLLFCARAPLGSRVEGLELARNSSRVVFFHTDTCVVPPKTIMSTVLGHFNPILMQTPVSITISQC